MNTGLITSISVLDLIPVFATLVWAGLAMQLQLVKLDTAGKQAAAMGAVLALCVANELVSAFVDSYYLTQRLYPITVIAPLMIGSSAVHRHSGAKFLLTLCYVVALTHLVPIAPDFASYLLGGITNQARLMVVIFVSMFLLAVVQTGLRPIFIDLLERQQTGWEILAAFSSIGVVIIVVVFELHGVIEEEDLLYINLIVIAYMIILFVVVAVFVRRGQEELESAHSESLVRAQARAQAEAEELREKQQEEERRRRHDQRHAVQVIIDEIESGQIDQALEHLRAIRGDVAVPEMVYCRDRAVNSVFKLWSSRAEEQGIEVSIRADVPVDLNIDSMELSTMFANLMDNAYEGCMRLERNEAKRFIDVNCTYNRGRLTCQIRNACRRDIEFTEGMPSSQKHGGGGIGTRSVRQTVESHGGMIRYSSEDGVFTVKLVMAV